MICPLRVNTVWCKGRFCPHEMPFVPFIHPPLHLSSIWLTSDAAISFFSTSALHHPLPSCSLGVVPVVCVEKEGEGEASQWCTFLYMTNLSHEFEGLKKNTDAPVRE